MAETTQSETTIDALPYELLRHILVEFTDRRDRLAAWCVCHGWRSQLRAGRRYCWGKSALQHKPSLTALARRSITDGLSDLGFWLFDVCVDKEFGTLSRLLPQTVSSDGAHQGLRRQLRYRGCRWMAADAKRAILAGDPHAIAEALDDGHGLDSGVIYALLATGNFSIVDTQRDAGSGPILFGSVVAHAAADGRIDVIDWVRSRTGLDHHAPICEGVLRAAFERNPLVVRLIEWATADGALKWTADDVKQFHRCGNVEVAEWIWTHRRQCISPQDFLRAVIAGPGNANTALWALDNGIGDPAAIRKESCTWLIERPFRYDSSDITVEQVDRLYAAGLIDPRPYDCVYAAHHKNMALLAWLCEHVSEAHRDGWRNETMWRQIAMHGHPACMALLVSKGVDMSACMLADATWAVLWFWDDVSDIIACVELLVGAGCALTARSCLTLARLGATNLLRVAVHEKEVPWDARACLKTALLCDSAACRQTAAWIAQEIGVDVGAFEQDLLCGD
ncbi:F-box incomplete domain containing protein [Pandoravirus salinus]|uniref:F-box incomplete domain containing protein n=1 Tax=Pandoravirus salinus TaxID=1349410 RepID=S4W4L4_9VIRU|nr:F-box incomplete domain [Pandoravirus salinus]AGO85280.2 F-box incomplete domain containing protein [Pandoravirus salinus]